MPYDEVPAAILNAFEGRVAIGGKDLCRLLGMDAKTLSAHVRAGHIEYLQLGLGEKRPRRSFMLKHVVQFLERQSQLEVPLRAATSRTSPRGSAKLELGFMARLEAKRKADALSSN